MRPLAAGDRVPPFRILRGHEDEIAGDELWRGGPTVVLCYVLDWSGAESPGECLTFAR